MSVSVYVGNLAPSTTEDMVRAAFVSAGCPVKKVSIMRNSQNDRSRGFGFVEVGSEEEANAAMQTMTGVVVEGQALEVRPARERVPVRGERNFQSYGGPGERGRRRPGGAKRRR